MDDRIDTRGCATNLAIIAVVVSLLIWRAQSWDRIWPLLLVLAIGLVAYYLGRFYFVQNQSALGCVPMVFGLLAFGIIAYFILTANVDQTNQFLRQVGLPVVPTVASSSVASEPTSVAASSTPTLAPVPTSTAEALTPTPPPAPTPTAVVVPSSATTPTVYWWQADPQYAKALTPELEWWRAICTIIIGVQYLLSFWLWRKTGQGYMGCMLVITVISALLTFTKIGEWLYQIALWVLGLGILGIIASVILSALLGRSGTGNLTALLIGGYLYYDPSILLWWLAPSLVVASIVLTIRVLRELGSGRHMIKIP
jgi:hypothetical protein